jgi:hypothetical protein
VTLDELEAQAKEAAWRKTVLAVEPDVALALIAALRAADAMRAEIRVDDITGWYLNDDDDAICDYDAKRRECEA